jgi:chromosome segregation ATPase
MESGTQDLDAQQEREQLQAQVQHLKAQEQVAQQEREQLQARIEQLQAQVQHLQAQEQEREMVHSQYRAATEDQLTELNAKLTRLEEDFDQYCRCAEANIADIQQQAAEDAEELAIAARANAQLENERTAANDLLKDTRKSLCEVQARYDASLATRQQQSERISSQEQEIGLLAQEIRSSQGKLHETQVLLETYKRVTLPVRRQTLVELIIKKCYKLCMDAPIEDTERKRRMYFYLVYYHRICSLLSWCL